MGDWLLKWPSHPESESLRGDGMVPSPAGNLRQAMLCVWRN
jgi:hypothetical protein